MNVLISSAGRRTSLVRAFQEAQAGLVAAADSDVLAPSLFIADEAVVVPRVDDPEFLDVMLGVCDRLKIDMIIPTIDTELAIYAQNRDLFESRGVTPVVSSEKLVDVTSSKRKTESAFGDRGIVTPKSWKPTSSLSDDLPSRLFVKPDRGSASAFAFAVDRTDLDGVLSAVPDPIIQERIEAVEMTVDALLDRHGDTLHMVPRIRLKTVGGESVQGVTMPDEPIRDWLLEVLSVVKELGGWGPMTIQLFATSPVPTLIEVNPRFGGGFPLAHASGARYPEWLIEMLAGREVPNRLGEYRKGLFMTRTLDERFVDGGWAQ